MIPAKKDLAALAIRNRLNPNPKESEDLIDFFKNLIKEELTILIIEHDMRVVMGISDWVTVMDEVKKIKEGPPETVYNHPQVIEAYLGRDDDEA